MPELKRYQRRVAERLCVACGLRRPVRGTRRCEPCARIHNEESQDCRDRRRRHGMCLLCGARKPARRKRHCAPCLATARGNNARYRHGEELPASHGDMQRDPIKFTPRR
jgi:hypothetical protein